MSQFTEVIQEALATIGPLLDSEAVSVDYVPQALPNMPLQVPILRQALLNILNATIAQAPRGRIHIDTSILAQEVLVRIEAYAGLRVALAQKPPPTESLQMARQLIELLHGSLNIAGNVPAQPTPAKPGSKVFAVEIALPIEEQLTVLAIDDNADTLQLFQRYLANTRYHFVSARDADSGLQLAQELAPQIIVLDVMMPEQDGWTLLGHLREHPKTCHSSIVVCTILPQEQLALTLGAAGFIRKPVSRNGLLSALQRLRVQQPTARCQGTRCS
jgi:CheY-like chemotaxis protein